MTEGEVGTSIESKKHIYKDFCITINHLGDLMRFKLLLLTLMLCVAGSAIAGGSGKGNDPLRRSNLYKQGTPGSYPRNFNAEPANPTKTTMDPAVSTGYYIVDSDDNADTYWKPYGFLNPNNEVDLNYQPETWRKVVSGGHQFPPSYWDNNSEGKPFFQNPATFTAQFAYGTDSVDNAFAGPIPIGFPFYFNGIRYDSFYVSTNGLIGLSNRRYFYGDDGTRVQREVQPGVFSFYDPEAEDTRAPAGASGAQDPTPDDYGYRCVAMGKAANTATITEGIANASDGIRNPTNAPGGNGITGIANFTNGAPLIMPFWGNTQMSVFNSSINLTDDFSSVRYKRSVSGDKLIIWYQRITPRGTWTAYRNGGTWGTVNYVANIRPGSTNYIEASCAVVLNRLDSSVCVYFTDFQGVAFINNFPFTASNLFRMNTTNAVRGTARHYAYNSIAGTGNTTPTRYTQYTIYYTQSPGSNPKVFASGTQQQDDQTPSVSLVVCYKQWKNTVRAVTTEYRVRPRDPNAPLDYTVTVPSANVNNFELLAGDSRLGGITPIAIFQNLSNDIQGPNGVNYQQQNIKFRTRFRIINLASKKTVYNRLVRVNSFFSDNTNFTIGGYRLGTFNTANPPVFQPTTPAPSANGVPPYAYVQVQFPPFEPNEFIDDQIGRFRAVIIAEPIDSTDQGFKDAWPFDDTTNVTLFVMRRLSSFNEDIREYHVIDGTPMPSVLKWVNIGGEVNDGDNATNNPPPPRGEYAAANNNNFKLATPVVQLNRIIDGSEPPTAPGGDELRSFPIDLRGRLRAVLSLAYHRTEKQSDYPRGWADNTLIGPEPRVALNGSPTATTNGGTQTGGTDQLLVEYARPSLDQVNNIVVSSVPGATAFAWNWHPRCCGQSAITDNPAFSIFGGGGFRRGYDEAVKDTAISQALGLRTDLFDDGKDFEWKKVYLPIPDTFINAPNDGARNFRFRLRVAANRHGWNPGPSDDQDNFFVKNVRILFPSEVTDIEALSVITQWPFVETPASQATAIPITVRLANNTGRDAQAFKVRVGIIGEDDTWKIANDFNNKQYYDETYVYYRFVTIPFMVGNKDILIQFPSWNARRSQRTGTNTQNYFVTAKVDYPGGDLEPLNDSTYSVTTMNFAPAFSYYPTSEQNQVPQFTQQLMGQSLVGKGLGTLGYVSAGWNANTAFGDVGGSGSGQIAVRFNLTTQDTIFGFQAYFASLNSDQNNVRFNIYDDANQVPASQPRAGTTLTKGRGFDDILQSDKYDTVSTYLYQTPVVLGPGEYWVTVGQLSTIGMELGATGARSGLQLGNHNTTPIPGQSNYNLYLDKRFRRYTRNGTLLNDNRFAFENSYRSGQWQQFAATIGNVGYNHLDFSGTVGVGPTYTRGSWIPMIRPYLGQRSFGDRTYVKITPVELTVFEGQKRSNAVDLWWETASEKNNSGFNVERRVNGDQTWADLGFIGSKAGANGNSTQDLNYNYTDKNVTMGSTYEYRLRQVDLDGSATYSQTLKFSFDGTNSTANIESLGPNPFVEGTRTTTLNYTVSSASRVKVDIVDMMGNVVKTLIDGDVTAGRYTAEWDGTNNDGAMVANGSYIYRFVAGDAPIETRVLKVIR
jgi:hypothetical protein